MQNNPHLFKISKEVHKFKTKFNCLNANQAYSIELYLHYMWKNGLLTKENIENNLISFLLLSHIILSNRKTISLEQELKDMLPCQFDLVGDWSKYAKIFEKDSDLTDWNKTGDYTYLYNDCYFTVTTESERKPTM